MRTMQHKFIGGKTKGADSTRMHAMIPNIIENFFTQAETKQMNAHFKIREKVSQIIQNNLIVATLLR